jgi:endoglucanase
MRTYIFLVIAFFVTSCAQPQSSNDPQVPDFDKVAYEDKGSTPVAKHGVLKVKGNRIVDQSGNDVQLRGLSLFWSQWKGEYYTASTVKWFTKNWGINVIRAAMAVDHNGYATNESEKQKIFTVIDAAVENGIYVIVDFHVHDANKYLPEAQSFFGEVAQRYGHLPHIIYEPWNEPVKQSWAQVIKPYHEAVISTIRKHDADNLIVCGTRTWSQDVDEASADPIKDENLAYTLHFYASTHKDDLRMKAKTALNKGVALMVTEYGTCEATGDGVIDSLQLRKWYAFMNEHKLSHCNWSISDKNESASIFLPGTGASGWTDSSISISGQLVKREIRNNN